MKRRMVLSVVFPFLAVLMVSCGGESGEDQTLTVRERLYRLAQASVLYIGDNDDTVMLADRWMDALEPYSTSPLNFRSPAVPEPGYGFALNSAIAGQPLSLFPRETTVMLFDSTVLTRNATAPLSTQPSPGRYDGTNTMAYLDGRVAGYAADGSPINASVARVRRPTTGLALYSADNDDLYPQQNWMDGLSPYVTSQTDFRSPQFDGTAAYGYALNSVLVGVNSTSIANPSQTPTIFDSLATSRNAIATSTQVPNPGRYEGQNATGFVNGSVRPTRP